MAPTLRQDGTMSRTNWKRLYDIVVARMSEIGMTKNGLEAVGGPSKSWLWDLQHREGRPTAKMSRSLEALDTALGWPLGTSFRLARDPFDEGSITAQDEEDRLVKGDESTQVPSLLPPHEKAIRDFASSVQGTLRSMPEAEAKDLMRRMYQMLGIS